MYFCYFFLRRLGLFLRWKNFVHEARKGHVVFSDSCISIPAFSQMHILQYMKGKKQNSKCQNENLLPLPAVFCFFSAPKQMHLCTVYTEGTSIISTAVLLITRYRAMMMMMMCSAYPRNLSVQLSLVATSTTITYMLFLSFSLSKYPIFLGFWG